MKTINISLNDANGIKDAKHQLVLYKKKIDNKTRSLVSRLITAGLSVARENAGGGEDGEVITFYKDLNSSDHVVMGKIVITSKPHVDSQGRTFYPHLAVEFGAGIFYNAGNSNPKASEFGMGVGTFPGQKFAITPGYWWYKGEDGNLHFSLGTKATMPMYKASKEVILQVDRIAKEVFGNG